MTDAKGVRVLSREETQAEEIANLKRTIAKLKLENERLYVASLTGEDRARYFAERKTPE